MREIAQMYLGTALRHIHRLFNEGLVTSLSDERLLERFVETRDEAAFAVLVERHGPMVLATCRALLKNDHDAEDAFQATFLVLARKASSVRGSSGLGGWLHRVAYRVALRAGATERRRRQREILPEEDIPVATTDSPLDELRPALHEEIERLPESYRIPVVLCFLEGLTREHVAVQLNLSEAGIRNRLTKALDLLKRRLTRRGLAPSVVALAALARESTAATVPASLVSATVRSAVAFAAGTAMTGTASVAVTELASQSLRTMCWTKLKVGSALLALMSVAGVSAGLLAAGPSNENSKKSPAPRSAVAQAPAPAANPQPVSKDKPGETFEIYGRVVDPSGRAVAGASVRPNLWAKAIGIDDPKSLETTSERDGLFVLRLPGSLPSSFYKSHGGLEVVASAPGFGPGWTEVERQPGEWTVRLVEDSAIEGRIIDLEGRPITDARIELVRITLPEPMSMARWLQEIKDRGLGQATWMALRMLPATGSTTTAADGRFRLTGIGRDRIATLRVSGPTIETTNLYALSCDGTEVHASFRQSAVPVPFVFHPRRFEIAVAPSQPIEGIVRDKDTGQPLSGVRIEAGIPESDKSSSAHVFATTDATGHYRITGLTKAPAYRILASSGAGQPYPGAAFRVSADSPSLAGLDFPIALKRGVVIRGKVTDKATGRPVVGYVNCYAFRDNPFVSQFPGYAQSREAQVYLKDGEYEIVGLPGRNLITCRAESGHYLREVGAEAIQGYHRERGLDTVPSALPVMNYSTLADIDIDPRAESATRDLQVDPGRTVTLSIVDPEGRPLRGASAPGFTDLFSSSSEQTPATLELRGLDPSKPLRVTVNHEGRRLTGSVYLKGGETGPLTLRLQPWGTIMGRIVDEDGRPRSGMGLQSRSGDTEHEGALPASLVGRGIPLGKDGRFRVEGLVPGLRYGGSALHQSSFSGTELFKDLVVAPGEVRDLGDLKVISVKGND
jgi:RNA polymerase sigma factor (sigma-70 family)